jgi:branched-chain amino acid aminotransferase
LAAVVRIDGRVIGTGAPGPMTARLTALFRQRTASGGTRIV